MSFLQGDGSNQRKKRGRGTIKGLAVATKRVKERIQKLPIEFSERRGGPIGPSTRAFVDEVVLFTRKWGPLIGVKSWKYIKEEVKEKIAEEILVRRYLNVYYFLHYVSKDKFARLTMDGSMQNSKNILF